jgi:hypothetical protein
MYRLDGPHPGNSGSSIRSRQSLLETARLEQAVSGGIEQRCYPALTHARDSSFSPGSR